MNRRAQELGTSEPSVCGSSCFPQTFQAPAGSSFNVSLSECHEGGVSHPISGVPFLPSEYLTSVPSDQGDFFCSKWGWHYSSLPFSPQTDSPHCPELQTLVHQVEWSRRWRWREASASLGQCLCFHIYDTHETFKSKQGHHPASWLL